MCWAEKCCYFLPLNLGCVLLGVCSFIQATAMLVASITCYVIEHNMEMENSLSAERPHFARMLGLDLNVSSVHIVLSIIILAAIFWMIFSAMLVLGIVMNKPSFILCYFAYGILLTIVCQLSALLVLLHNNWVMSIILFIASMIHIHYLVVVHSVYELMQRGKDFRFRQHEDDVDPIIDCFDDNPDSL